LTGDKTVKIIHCLIFSINAVNFAFHALAREMMSFHLHFRQFPKAPKYSGLKDSLRFLGETVMEKYNLAGENPKSKIYWAAMLCLSLALLGLAALRLDAFSLQDFAVLLVALAVAVFANQHQVRIPRTGTNFSAREIVVFWGIIWLGVPGGVFLAVASSLVRFDLEQKNKFRWLYGVFCGVSAAFASASVFYLVLNFFTGFGADFVAGETVAFPWLIAAIVSMAAAHYLLSTILRSIFLYLEEKKSLPELWKTDFSHAAAGYVITASAVFLLHVLFLEFGLTFGFVVLPITIVSHFAYRLHLKRLEQKTKEIGEASRIHLATVEALATAIDARDQVGVGHVRRTQIYAVGLGEILGLSADELKALNAGALLHDIGKLAVPDHILNKPGRLTPAELEKTKIHASVGASILEKVDFSYPVIPTVKYHHECWDGSGYPEGLKGQGIPLTARILSVADSYDTLRGARPYRAAISREDARKFLISGAGTQFDPKVVDVFLRNLKKFEAAIEAEKLSYAVDGENIEDSPVHGTEPDSKSYVEQIKRANREVFTLYELARIFSSSLNLKDTFALFAEKIGGLVPYDTCVIYLTDETGNEAKAVYAEGKNAPALLHRTVKPGEGATGYVLKKRQPVCNVNPGLDFSFSRLEFVQEYSAMASLPLIADDKLLGAVSLYSCALENYEDEHLRLLETVSRIASDAISKSIHHAETETKAFTDPMTGLPNARSLQIQFDKEAARADRNGTSFQVLMLDLDGFKAVNDTYGHKAGDRLLRELSKAMRAQLRDYDFLARYAGDEFVAVIPETEDVSVEELCRRLEKSVTDFVLPIGDGRFARVGISIGAASYPNGGGTLDQIIISADRAMYNVKSLRKRLREEKPENSQKQNELPLSEPQPAPKPIAVRSVEPPSLSNEETAAESNSGSFVVELDERHIISSAIN
jgi:diguanylate cyclase (GGDEF)-like protein/putative nucleotidyltransferase with HDIG domain